MSEDKSSINLQEVKKRLKRIKFTRQESWRYVKVKGSWRKPRGIDSKMRRSIKGWPRLVKVGYRTPKLYRGLHPSGFNEVVVFRPEDLDHVVTEKAVVRMAHTVGAKKRAQIMDKAKAMGIRVVNPCRVSGVESEESKKASS